MKINFNTLAVLSSVVCFVLAGIWLLTPKFLLTIWGVPYSEAVALVARRGAALFGGVGVMLYIARNAEISFARYGLIVGFAFGCTALALLGIFELVSGHARFGILLAVSVEVPLAIAFFKVARYDRIILLRKV